MKILKVIAKHFAVGVAFTVVIFNFFFLFLGLQATMSPACFGEKRRFEVLLPTFRWGCWLGEPVGYKEHE